MKLLLAAPCNFVSSDPEFGHSLIAVFHDIAVKVPPEAEVPKNAILPKEWAIFSKWGLSREEEGQQYFLVSEVYWPDGTLLNQSKTKSNTPASNLPTANSIAFIIRSQAFPFGQNGEVKIRLWIEMDRGDLIEVVHEPIELSISVHLERTLGLP